MAIWSHKQAFCARVAKALIFFNGKSAYFCSQNCHFWSGVCSKPCILRCKTTFAFTTLARNCNFRASGRTNGHSVVECRSWHPLCILKYVGSYFSDRPFAALGSFWGSGCTPGHSKMGKRSVWLQSGVVFPKNCQHSRAKCIFSEHNGYLAAEWRRW